MTETDTTAQAKANNQSNSDTVTGIASSVVSADTRNQTVQARTNSSIDTCSKCGAHGHKRVDCPVKTVAHLVSESVIDPN